MNIKTHNILFAFLIIAIAAGLVLADPLPGRDVTKFVQVPLDDMVAGGALFFGHDNVSTAYTEYDAAGAPQGYSGHFMADDFADQFNTPVVHIKWWGSYLNNKQIQPVDSFLVVFESDIPAAQHPLGLGFSIPGNVLSSQIVTRAPLSPMSGTFTETSISPGELDISLTVQIAYEILD